MYYHHCVCYGLLCKDVLRVFMKFSLDFLTVQLPSAIWTMGLDYIKFIPILQNPVYAYL